VQEHFEEWWGYGTFFIVASVAQGVYGLILLDVLPIPSAVIRRLPWRESADGSSRTFYLLGILGNAAIIALYVVTRTVGIPFFGPEAGEVEALSAISVVSKVIELALIVCLAALVRSTPAELTRPELGHGDAIT
jgi:hypothetical protein